MQYGIKAIIDQNLSAALDEAIERGSKKTVPLSSLVQTLSSSYDDIAGAHVILASYSVVDQLRCMRPENIHHMMNWDSESIVFNGRESRWALMGVPTIAYSHLPEGYLVILRKGWFEFTNEKTTQIGHDPGPFPSGPVFDVDFMYAETTKFDKVLQNQVMIKVIRDKVSILEFKETDGVSANP